MADKSDEPDQDTLGKKIDTVIDALRGGLVSNRKVEEVLDAAGQAKRDHGVKRSIGRF